MGPWETPNSALQEGGWVGRTGASSPPTPTRWGGAGPVAAPEVGARPYQCQADRSLRSVVSVVSGQGALQPSASASPSTVPGSQDILSSQVPRFRPPAETISSQRGQWDKQPPSLAHLGSPDSVSGQLHSRARCPAPCSGALARPLQTCYVASRKPPVPSEPCAGINSNHTSQGAEPSSQ